MPVSPKRPCRHPGCRALVSGSAYCDLHRKQTERQYDDRRGSSAERGYNHRWRKARETFLRRSPLCVRCAERDMTVAATVVDHIVPHKGDSALFWDSSNWQALCKPCHDGWKQRQERSASLDGDEGEGEAKV